MSNRRFSAGPFPTALLTLCIALLLSACQNTTSMRRFTGLAPCTASESLFAELPFEEWPERYHETVNAVVEAHLASLGSIASESLACTADDFEGVIAASQPLRSLAGGLPAWKSGDRMASLSETDAAAVLLEFVRVYECSLNERRHYLPVLVSGDTGVDYNDAQEKQRKIIARELDLARTSLDRTLAILAGFDQLRPLTVDLECVKRASLDLRNVLGLAAEASACLPKSWDAHGSLRDLPE